ncbi:hypothetical protein BC835DRAFT_1519541 [Cytidiella melzeri]|nr:hypothetical protein BC835DRAFT_1519541 [Cytidiella melzeri]
MRARIDQQYECCGIAFPSNSSLVYLPLERVTATVDIVDVSATVKLTQEFWQYSVNKVRLGQYVFPVPARAAVCAFEMRTQDGQVINAVAKEKLQARKEHDAAIQQGLMTGLVEHLTDDVFQISLGVLPGQQLLTTTLTYVMNLMEADVTDQVRFLLPVVVGMRYGEPPEGMRTAAMPERVSITVNVRMKGTIRSIISPSHTISTSSPSTVTALQSVSYLSTAFLQQDFVLSIKADGLDSPRCFAETHPTGTTALQLTIVPKFNLPPIPVQEYIFLVDQSASMKGSRIETAKNTLIMLLRSLPSSGTSFNIFTFSSRCENLFEGSVVYSEKTLTQATRYVENIRTHSGTRIRDALRRVFETRDMLIPTACFVLTDGEAHNIDATLQTVSDAVALSTLGAPLRVFTLGIGRTTSTAMCEGIARLGNGICLMAVESESIVAKCSKLLRASRTYVLKNISIDWGAPVSASSDLTTQTDMFCQAPEQIESIFAGNRFIVFALVKRSDYVIPDNIVIKAQRDGQGEVLTFDIPVQQLPIVTDHKATHLIHTLAARRIIQELDDRDKTGAVTHAKEVIIHLGEQYQLASRFTSFIAVENENGNKVAGATVETISESVVGNEGDEEDMGWTMVGDERSPSQNALARTLFGARSRGVEHLEYESRSMPRAGVPQAPQSTSGSAAVSSTSERRRLIMSRVHSRPRPISFERKLPPPTASAGVPFNPVSYGSSPTPAVSQKRPGTDTAAVASIDSQSFSRFNKPLPAPPADFAMAPPPGLHMDAYARGPRSAAASPSATSSSSRSHSSHQIMAGSPRASSSQDSRGLSVPAFPSRSPADPSLSGIDDDTAALIRLQSFDGSFVPTPELEMILGRTALDEGRKFGTDPTVWATVLAIAYLRKHLGAQPELLEGLVEKATVFVDQTPGVDLEELLDVAKLLV